MNCSQSMPYERSQLLPERHPLQPFLPQGTRVLFLGSFPPQQKRWCMPFFYPNYINDHWRIMGAVFFDDRNHFVDPEHRTFRLDLIKPFLISQCIGYYDTALSVRRLRDNASDKFLEVVTPTDICALTATLTQLRVIAVTGELATTTLCKTLGVTAQLPVGQYVEITMHRTVRIYRLPSSSRAYPLAFGKKVEAYRHMFESL